MNLEKANLPSFIEIDGSTYAIKTDFHWGLVFMRMAEEKHLLSDFDVFYEDYIPEDKQKGLNALTEFYVDRQKLPRTDGMTSNEKILDYSIDAEYIFSAFMEQYHINLFSDKLHWLEFQALMRGLHNTVLNDIMEARSYNPSDKRKYETILRQRKQMWEILPDTENDDELKDFMNQLGY